MELKQLSSNFNRIIYILNRIFDKYDRYKITCTNDDELNNQLDLFVQYEINEEDGIYMNVHIVSIPDWVLESNENNKDVEDFIKLMSDVIPNYYD